MTSVNKICLSALLLGAAAIATPAFAQAAAEASATTANTPSTQAAEQPAAATQAAADSTDIGTRSAANANVDAVGNTSKKYVRSHRAADFAKEQSVTAQLNQQAAAAAAPTTR